MLGVWEITYSINNHPINTNMWHWHHEVPISEEQHWQDLLAAYPNSVLSQNYAATHLEMDVYWEQEEEALLFAACHGGKVAQLVATDWVAATAPENQAPLLIRQQIVISSSDDAEVMKKLRKRYPKRIVLTMPAEMAFGTGDHATTSTCLRLLCDYARSKEAGTWKLTDAGCGTAILALAGLHLGAASAIAYDFDPQAVEIAQRNIDRNGGAEKLQLFQADVFEWKAQDDELADILLANLFSTVLQKAFPMLISSMNKGATLIISGILKEQADETIAIAQKHGLELQKRITRGKWTTAQLTRPS